MVNPVPVPMFTPVTEGDQLSLASFPAEYLSPFCKEVAVIHGAPDAQGNQGCQRGQTNTTMTATVLKIVTYICSLGILPLLAAILNVVIRCCGTKYHYLDAVQPPANNPPQPPQPVAGGTPAAAANPQPAQGNQTYENMVQGFVDSAMGDDDLLVLKGASESQVEKNAIDEAIQRRAAPAAQPQAAVTPALAAQPPRPAPTPAAPAAQPQVAARTAAAVTPVLAAQPPRPAPTPAAPAATQPQPQPLVAVPVAADPLDPLKGMDLETLRGLLRGANNEDKLVLEEAIRRAEAAQPQPPRPTPTPAVAAAGNREAISGLVGMSKAELEALKQGADAVNRQIIDLALAAQADYIPDAPIAASTKTHEEMVKEFLDSAETDVELEARRIDMTREQQLALNAALLKRSQIRDPKNGVVDDGLIPAPQPLAARPEMPQEQVDAAVARIQEEAAARRFGEMTDRSLLKAVHVQALNNYDHMAAAAIANTQSDIVDAIEARAKELGINLTETPEKTNPDLLRAAWKEELKAVRASKNDAPVRAQHEANVRAIVAYAKELGIVLPVTAAPVATPAAAPQATDDITLPLANVGVPATTQEKKKTFAQVAAGNTTNIAEKSKLLSAPAQEEQPAAQSTLKPKVAATIKRKAPTQKAFTPPAPVATAANAAEAAERDQEEIERLQEAADAEERQRLVEEAAAAQPQPTAEDELHATTLARRDQTNAQDKKTIRQAQAALDAMKAKKK